MKYLIATLLLLGIISCDRPDYYLCSDSDSQEAENFIFKCMSEKGRNSFRICTDEAKKIFCSPGYKPKEIEECNCPGTKTELKSVNNIKNTKNSDW